MKTNDLTSVIYKAMYPGVSLIGLNQHRQGFTFKEMRLSDGFSGVGPFDADLSSSIGPVEMKFPVMSAAMDAITGPVMAKAIHEIGGVGIIYRTQDSELQLSWIEEALSHKTCFVDSPKTLKPTDKIEVALNIRSEYGFDTMPVVDEDGILVGILFYKDVSVDQHLTDTVTKWMKPFKELRVGYDGTSFLDIREKITQERTSLLPIIDEQRKFKGLYFKKDLLYANPSMHLGKPLVGMAVGVEEGDIERAKVALDMGVGVIVIDSSHGNCPPVINQAKKLVKLSDGRAAIIAGNVASIDGYLNLAKTGVDAVKFGIGPGVICTTSEGTGVGSPMFSLIQEASFARKFLLKKRLHAPKIIPDGSIGGSGDMVIALAAGGHACMAGKWLAGFQESHSYQTEGPVEVNGRKMVKYWGMASAKAIKTRLAADRYGKGKRAPEGVENLVPYRKEGLKKGMGMDIELIKGGFAHTGSKDIVALHEFGSNPFAFWRFSAAGQSQITA